VRPPLRVAPLLIALALAARPAGAASDAGEAIRDRGDRQGEVHFHFPRPMIGFSIGEDAEELVREKTVAGVFKADSLRRHLRILTAEPHVAGTPADRATAEYVRERLAAYGWDARIEEVPVYLNYPTLSRLELVAPARETLALRERGVPWDKDAYSLRAFDAFHGYSASGEVTAGVVYANYGDVDDFKKLAELGIEVRGRIALVRYGKIFRGLKVRNAEKAGAAGVIIYSDPADDGFAKADPYPRGPARPEDAIQRGSVQFLSEGPGDPTTPGWGSRAGGKRLAAKDAKGIPRIPCRGARRSRSCARSKGRGCRTPGRGDCRSPTTSAPVPRCSTSRRARTTRCARSGTWSRRSRAARHPTSGSCAATPATPGPSARSIPTAAPSACSRWRAGSASWRGAAGARAAR